MAKSYNQVGSSDFSRCPIPKTHRRLIEAHVLWHQALDQYHQPEFFHANLNATIQALRNVTFVLQAEKKAVDNFDQWYAPWQEQLKANTLLTWLKDARNVVVKQGELEINSTAVVKLLTWRDHMLVQANVPPNIPPSLILRNLPLLELLSKTEVPPAGELKGTGYFCKIACRGTGGVAAAFCSTISWYRAFPRSIEHVAVPTTNISFSFRLAMKDLVHQAR